MSRSLQMPYTYQNSYDYGYPSGQTLKAQHYPDTSPYAQYYNQQHYHQHGARQQPQPYPQASPTYQRVPTQMPYRYHLMSEQKDRTAEDVEPTDETEETAPPETKPTWMCLQSPCVQRGVGFHRKADLDRHVLTNHEWDIAPRFDCGHPTCHRKGKDGFTRKDKMQEHEREVHGKKGEGCERRRTGRR